MLNWLKRFDTFCFLDNQGYPEGFNGCIIGAGVASEMHYNAKEKLAALAAFTSRTGKWYFGQLAYDLKNELHGLSSAHHDGIQFPDAYFFEPEVVIQIAGSITIHAADPQNIWEQINACGSAVTFSFSGSPVQSRMNEDEYLQVLTNLKKHIHLGDCYEINFCMEFYVEDASIEPSAMFERLCQRSPNPFTGFYRFRDKWLMCASPERFLRRKGDRLISQPMKGTAARDPGDSKADEKRKNDLLYNEKDRSENVMVVDLVRNDLSRVCKVGTVKVEELFGIYSYPNVHQMVSTISGELKDQCSFADIVSACFPMGSMTGAPKRRVMELIEKYERTKRGLFSGSIGYIEPSGDFDFNVVIRSLQYNSSSSYLSFQAGSGITFYSDPHKEWDECLLKARAIRNILEGK